MNVAQHCKESLIGIYWLALEAFAEQAASSFVTLVEMRCVSAVELAQKTRQSFEGNFDHQVVVVVHQAPCVEFSAVIFNSLLQQGKECRAVSRVFENDALSDTPIHYMVDVRFTLNSRLSCHGVPSPYGADVVCAESHYQYSYKDNAIMYSNHF